MFYYSTIRILKKEKEKKKMKFGNKLDCSLRLQLHSIDFYWMWILTNLSLDYIFFLYPLDYILFLYLPCLQNFQKIKRSIAMSSIKCLNLKFCNLKLCIKNKFINWIAYKIQLTWNFMCLKNVRNIQSNG